jgi:manganese/zinc/iron transport system permease protein
MNPYSDSTFFSFFFQLFFRFCGFVTGQIGWSNLASDEIQLLVLSAVAASAALLGCFLVLRRMTMLANSLSHTILLGIVLVYYLSLQTLSLESGDHHDPLSIQAMLLAALGMGVVTAFLTQFLTKAVGLQEDASIGLVFTSLFALGIIAATLLTRSAHIGAEVVMGNVDALQIGDLKLVSAVLVINVILIGLFYKEYVVTSFDGGLSTALGISTLFFDYLLMVQVSATAIGGFRAVGVLMVLALITGPPLTARLLVDNLRVMLPLSVGIGCVASFVGVALSRHLLTVAGMALSTGGIVVCVIGVFFVLAVIFKVVFQFKT